MPRPSPVTQVERLKNDLECAMSALREMRLDSARFVEDAEGEQTKVDGVAAKGVRIALELLRNPRLRRHF